MPLKIVRNDITKMNNGIDIFIILVSIESVIRRLYVKYAILNISVNVDNVL